MKTQKPSTHRILQGREWTLQYTVYTNKLLATALFSEDGALTVETRRRTRVWHSLSGTHPYLAFFLSQTQGGFDFPTTVVVRWGHLTNSGQCVMCRCGKCHFRPKQLSVQ